MQKSSVSHEGEQSVVLEQVQVALAASQTVFFPFGNGREVCFQGIVKWNCANAFQEVDGNLRRIQTVVIPEAVQCLCLKMQFGLNAHLTQATICLH